MVNKISSKSIFALVGIVFVSACSAATPTPKPVVTVAQPVATKPSVATQAPAPTAKAAATKPAPTTTPVIKAIATPIAAKPAPTTAPVSPVITDVIGTATGAGTFNTLLALLKSADMVNLLHQKGPWTVFAPTDAAFAKLPKGTLDTLVKPENKKKLADILLLHVFPGKDAFADLAKLKELRMSNGSTVKIAVKDKVMSVNDAKIVTADIPVANGVIQAIDTVLLPAVK